MVQKSEVAPEIPSQPFWWSLCHSCYTGQKHELISSCTIQCNDFWSNKHPASTTTSTQCRNIIVAILARNDTTGASWLGSQSLESNYSSKSTTLRSHDPLLPRFLMMPALEERRTLRESRIIPPTGSRPKYFAVISCPTDKPRALGWLTYKNHTKAGVSKQLQENRNSFIIEKHINFTLGTITQ